MELKDFNFAEDFEYNDLTGDKPALPQRRIKFPRFDDMIVFEDEQILALNKPSMLTSETDNSVDATSLRTIMQKNRPEAMLCHRLDKETSGIIIAAKNPEMYRSISIAFEKRLIIKKYHAMIQGVERWEERDIHLPISKQANFRAVIDREKGKDATTIVKTIENFRHYTLIEAQPLTGRFHQIRIHMSSVGFPLIGDQIYGGQPFMLSEIKRKKHKTGKYQEEASLMQRAALHARSLSIPYLNGEYIHLEAPYAPDFANMLRLLAKYDAL